MAEEMPWEDGANMSKTFLNSDKAILTTMVQADNPTRIIDLMDKADTNGAEAFGIQFEKMKSEFRTPEIYRQLFNHSNKPIYVTNYRYGHNEGKSDEVLAKELLELADCGATLCDVMGDYFDTQPDEFTQDEKAINKQKELINCLHNKGVEVLMSSHIFEFTNAERVLEIAMEHQRRGADICKIVTGADTMQQQFENLKIIDLLKRELEIPFLFLSVGECRILRRISGEIGCCMYLCVQEYDDLATPQQPLLENVKAIRDNM